MSVRQATRKMTGTPYRNAPEIILGRTPFDTPQVTIKWGYDTYVSIADVRIIEQMLKDLPEAAEHLYNV